ncbi:hypothetical protein CAPTEDRAFT_199480 [Capitella teleta]|uniref:Uncharacterized protein n=1 Tax=Capitella teleta TaxID=283909 RepID=R7V6M3_CAPTE|nr:hypothetical protein CAPTEDRAFT_199480 [Capitella teleta]|eukprot:ELU14528.1 hypothetical protein CAPTEDRAFT_199480 [Capitella teleta]
MESLKGKVVIVTGSTSGIGAACAVSFAKYGSKVVITGRNTKRMDDVRKDCLNAGAPEQHLLTIKGNLSESKCINEIIDLTIEKFGSLDVIVHSAGYSVEARPKNVTRENLREVFRIHLTCGYELVQRALPHLKKTKGTIVFIGSMIGIYPIESATPYCTTKRAEDQLAKLMAAELAPHGIRVNSIIPAWVKTNILQSSGVTLGSWLDVLTWRLLASLHPMKRCGKPEEIAEYTAFVASDCQRHVTGKSFHADGGSDMTSSISYDATQRMLETFLERTKSVFNWIGRLFWLRN